MSTAKEGLALHTKLVTVNPGQVLIGVMTLTGHSGSDFDYNCDFTGIAGTSLKVTNIEQLTWLIETLECYGITKSTDYPDTDLSNMSAIKVSTGSTHPTLTGRANNPVTDCGQHTVIVSDSATDRRGRPQLLRRPAQLAVVQQVPGADVRRRTPPRARARPAATTPRRQRELRRGVQHRQGPGGQSDWKWCNKCQGLTFAGNPYRGKCPAGGNHTHVG